MTGYALPTTTDWVTSSWADHRNRNPPSSEPGTDYGSGYGSPCFAVGDGTVTSIKTTSSGGTGRYIEYRLDDGRTTRPLHLSQVWVHVGQRIARGQQIGLTGASGYGSDWYYGAHVHQTLWPGNSWDAPTIDFAAYVGQPTPAPQPPPLPEEDDDMAGFYFYADPAQAYGWFSEGTGKCRKVSKEEWEWRKATATTKGGVPYQLVAVSQQWYEKAFQL